MTKERTVIGIDLGGTKTSIALFDASSMHCLSVCTTSTNAEKGFSAVRENLVAAVNELRRPDTVGLGLGVPGLIDTVSGHIITMPNIPGAEGVELARSLEAELHLPTVIENDARCFAYAEALLGAGKGHRVVLGLTLGTGVGGGIVIDEKIYRGAHGFAGEFGHMLLRPDEPPFPADERRGEVEQFLSGSAMGKRCTVATSPKDYLEGDVCDFLHPQIFKEIAWLVTSLTYAVDPSIVVFGGSAGRALSPHLPAIESELKRLLLPSVPCPVLAIGTVKDAGVAGAGLLAVKISEGRTV